MNATQQQSQTEQPKMDINTAVNNLAAVVAKFQTTGADHAILQQSLQAVLDALNTGAQSAADLTAAATQIKALTEQNAELTAQVTGDGDTPE